jgi:hypothetical protein
MATIEDIEKALAKTDEELYVDLGTLPFKGAAGADPAKRGRELYGNVKRKLVGLVCEAPQVRALHGLAGTGEAKIAVVIADVILAHVAGVSPASIAVLMVREGLDIVCRENWKADA